MIPSYRPSPTLMPFVGQDNSPDFSPTATPLSPTRLVSYRVFAVTPSVTLPSSSTLVRANALSPLFVRDMFTAPTFSFCHVRFHPLPLFFATIIINRTR